MWKMFLFSFSTKRQQISLDVRAKKAFVSVPAKEYFGGHKNADLLTASFKVGD